MYVVLYLRAVTSVSSHTSDARSGTLEHGVSSSFELTGERSTILSKCRTRREDTESNTFLKYI